MLDKNELLSNFINKDLQLALLPMRFLENVFLLSTYSISNNYINRREEYKLYNNIKRLNQTQFKKMSVYGVFVMDAGLPVGLVQLLTTYVIVLLQFALT
ncbi:uncharacterized protein LOC123714391 [Pieris brassicae]|uniref:uncharacterized protein LOC123714391 n=1 Tax=Pieris brassicae TaxID=7116 RepID=UPI001E662139|nr:uncharacterized protein LOC123714391 [Pieris brassicae]